MTLRKEIIENLERLLERIQYGTITRDDIESNLRVTISEIKGE